MQRKNIMQNLEGHEVRVRFIDGHSFERSGTVLYTDFDGFYLQTNKSGNGQTSVTKYYIPWSAVTFLHLGTEIK